MHGNDTLFSSSLIGMCSLTNSCFVMSKTKSSKLKTWQLKVWSALIASTSTLAFLSRSPWIMMITFFTYLSFKYDHISFIRASVNKKPLSFLFFASWCLSNSKITDSISSWLSVYITETIYLEVHLWYVELLKPVQTVWDQEILIGGVQLQLILGVHVTSLSDDWVQSESHSEELLYKSFLLLW